MSVALQTRLGGAAAFAQFPETRYMGSKQKLIPFIQEIAAKVMHDSVLDAMAGTAVVAHSFKRQGKRVVTNDFLEFNYLAALAMVQNDDQLLGPEDVDRICSPHPAADDFIQRTFRGIYYADADNAWLDSAVAHIRELPTEELRAIAFTALCRACLKKRARGLFTYTGFRYDDGRRDLRLSFEEQFRLGVAEVQGAVFGGATPCEARFGDVFELDFPEVDLVYLDPPYVSAYSDNEYHRRYHFLEGLVSYWGRAPIQEHTLTKKTRKRQSPFDSKRTVHAAFAELFRRCGAAAILLSYSSNGIPTKDELIALLKETGRSVEVFEQNYTYSFSSHAAGNSENRVQEYLFLAR